ncbi:MAG: radical SAM family heme chaperone HemW [Candidatus Marinimicrobia bacterium]|nr:radical SAM family heme chaperone HemW [Candidatus Neomarinimicrobiota bacterium]
MPCIYMKELYLYIHIPFCRKKCRYCDFYSMGPDHDTGNFLNALRRSITYHADNISEYYEVQTLYLGGGTPNLLSGSQLAGIVEHVISAFHFTDTPEISIEINPEFAKDRESIRTFYDIGFNRLSIGVQSLNDAELRTLGRLHSRDTALQCLKHAREIFPNISTDLIYAVPGQTMASLEKSLNTLLLFEPEHLSAYNLSCEPGTPLAAAVEKGDILLHDEEAERNFFLFLHERMHQHGYRHYEISSYAKPGSESRHNSAYWSGADYLGIGPSAHTKLQDLRYSYLPDIKAFIRDPREFHTKEPAGDTDTIITRLRTEEGLRKNDVGSDTWKSVYKYAQKRSGLFLIGKDRISCTPEGWLLLDSILLDLI